MYRPSVRIVLLVIISYCIFMGGMVVGYILHPEQDDKDKRDSSPIEIHDAGTLTSPLLSCDSSLGSGEYERFSKDIEDQIRSFIVKKEALSISIYFRDLQNGATFGVNEKEEFAPASLLKIPVMIGFFKYSEGHPDILSQKRTYEEKLTDSTPYYPSEEQIELGVSYTVDDLIRRMIINSDNNAMLLLQQSYPNIIIDTVYQDLGLIRPGEVASEYMMSVKTYASFFRILYNASYLTKDMSEKALSILTKTNFLKGIVASVPSTVTVAHKFGEREYTDTHTKQLHDCGIVYYPTHPYLLCVMTKGRSFESLEQVIASISKHVYEEVNARIKSKQ